MIDRIEYSITDQCNLNCAYCCHYASIAKEYFVELQSFKDDVHRLAELTNAGRQLGTLGILGGEPLLHSDFIEIVTYARTVLPFSRIRVTTNGLLLNRLTKPQLAILHRFDIEILISKYRETDNFDTMDKLLTEYGIIHKFCSNNELVTFCKYAMDPDGMQDPKESHSKCELWQEYYTCHELRDGNLYPCSQIARAGSLNDRYGTNFEIVQDDYINIYKSTLNEIESFLRKTPTFCKYCKVDEWHKPVGKWKRSTGVKEEFI